ncbi:MAG: tetratricopeptide repeat protein [Planctomycetota bacterium]
MLKVSKEKLLVVLAVIFFGAVVWMITFDKSKTLEEWVLGQRPKTYYPVPPSDSAADLNKLDVTTRNPFISMAEKVEGRVELPLPGIVEKQFTLAGFRPFPDLRFYDKGLLKLSFGRPYPYDDSPRLPLPPARALPPMETLTALVSAIHEAPNAPEKPPEQPEEDVIYMRDGREIKGAYVTEDNEVVWFVRTGQDKVLPYNKQDIRDVKRVFTAEELYEVEFKKVSANDAFSWYRLSEWCFKKGLADKAVAALKKALEINNHELKFYQSLADYYISKNDLDREIALYRDALKSSLPNKEEVYYRLGRAYEKLKLFGDALAYYEKALALSPNYVEALMQLAGLYLGKEDYESASRTYERVRNLRNPDRDYLEALAQLQFRTGKLPEALKNLQDAQKDSELTSDGLNLMAMIASLNGDYKTVNERFPQAIYARPLLSSGWTNLGLLYLAAGQYPEAEMLFTEYAELNPTDETSYVGLGYLKWLKNKTGEAMASFQTALKKAPDSFPARYARGQMYFQLQQYPEAQQDFQWCLANHPSFTETLSYLAAIALYQKNPKEALRYYRAYFSQTSPEARSRPEGRGSHKAAAADECNFILALLGTDNIAQAKKILMESERLKKYVPALNISGWIDYKELNVEQAIRKFQAASALDPSSTYSRNSLDLLTKSSSQAISLDDFSRPDSNMLGRGWTETEKFGVEITIANKQCLFKGVQSLSKDGLTTMEKAVSRQSFIRFEARFRIGSESEAIGGIYLSSPAKDRTLFICRRSSEREATASSELIYGFSTRPDAPSTEWQSFKKTVVLGEDSKIALEVIGPKDRPTEYHCFVDDVLCGIIPLKGNVASIGKTQDSSYLIGIFGYGPMGKEWQMAVKTTRVFEEKTK